MSHIQSILCMHAKLTLIIRNYLNKNKYIYIDMEYNETYYCNWVPYVLIMHSNERFHRKQNKSN